MKIASLLMLLLQFSAFADGFHVTNGSKRNIAISLHSSGTTDAVESLHPSIEKVWRYVKKPLLRVGSKGASKSHGNSLKELLQAHTAVKVKINVKNGKKIRTPHKSYFSFRDDIICIRLTTFYVQS